MEKDLKTQNIRSLTAIYVGAIFLVSAVHWGVEEAFEFSIGLGEHVLIAAVITAFGGVLSNSLPNSVKHTLVYWRYRNVLSGHRCRTICTKDPRMHLDDLKHQWPDLFLHEMNPYEQNAYWYRKIYFTVRNTPEVAQAHRSFLLFRDAATGLLILFVGMVVWLVVSEIVSPVQSMSIWSSVVLLIVYALVSQAARQSGNRMVANAVAVALRT